MKIPTFAEYSLNMEITQRGSYANTTAIRDHAKIACGYVVLTNGDKSSLTCVSVGCFPRFFQMRLAFTQRR